MGSFVEAHGYTGVGLASIKEKTKRNVLICLLIFFMLFGSIFKGPSFNQSFVCLFFAW